MSIAMRMKLRILAALLAAALAAGCATPTKSARRYSKQQANESLKTLDKVGLLIGDYPMAGAEAVLDGDTIEVKGLDATLRLLCIDTEETFKHEWERKAYSQGFTAYKKEMRGTSSRPVKMATPVGMEAKEFAKKFFDGAHTVRLERDHPGEIRDFYGRYLAYVLVQKNGKWLNYNIEAVRAGMSPYFEKYGRSRRFHAEFVKAQEEARAARIGIWDPMKENYGDYDERLAWWSPRGAAIEAFEKEMEGRPEYIALTRWDAMTELEKRLGQEVVLLAAVGDIKVSESGPVVVKLPRNRSTSFDLVFFDKDVFKATGLAQKKSEYIQVRGVVKRYKDKYRGQERLQFVVSLPGQVSVPGQAPAVAAPLQAVPLPTVGKPGDYRAVSATADKPDAGKDDIPVVSADPGKKPQKSPQPDERPKSPGATDTDPEIPADLNFDDLSELPLEP